MTDLYTQSIDNPLTPNARRKQVGGAFAILIGICSIGLAIGVSYYFFILTGVLIAIGACLTISFNNTVKSFEYSCNDVRLIFSTTSVISRTERKIEILLKDIVEYGVFQDIVLEKDFVMCPNANEMSVKFALFNVEGRTERVLFLPDEYINAFLRESLPKEVTTELKTGGKIC